jgi:pimeloyl-ACP methyl ester carboxylesterase
VICVGGGVIEMANSLSRNIGIIYLGSGTMDPVRFHQFGIEGVVDRYLAELLQARIQGPLVIVGYSYGGLVACVLTARLRLLQQERVVAILLEPSVPEARRNPARDMVARVTVYVRKLRERGLMTLYNSMRFRLKKQIQKRRSADVPNAHENPWVVIAPQIYRNIAAFRPSQRLCGDVYLVAGIAWLNKLLERFQMRLAESPCILDLGEVTHEEALNKQECIDSLISLIGEILNDRERPGVSTPDVTSGLHHVGQIPAL